MTVIYIYIYKYRKTILRLLNGQQSRLLILSSHGARLITIPPSPFSPLSIQSRKRAVRRDATGDTAGPAEEVTLVTETMEETTVEIVEEILVEGAVVAAAEGVVEGVVEIDH